MQRVWTLIVTVSNILHFYNSTLLFCFSHRVNISITMVIDARISHKLAHVWISHAPNETHFGFYHSHYTMNKVSFFPNKLKVTCILLSLQQKTRKRMCCEHNLVWLIFVELFCSFQMESIQPNHRVCNTSISDSAMVSSFNSKCGSRSITTVFACTSATLWLKCNDFLCFFRNIELSIVYLPSGIRSIF